MRLGGFTLLEMLVTLAIAGMIFVLITSLTAMAARTQAFSQSSRDQAALAEFRMTMRRLYFYADAELEFDVAFEGNEMSLAFVALVGLDAVPESVAQYVVLSVTNNTWTLRRELLNASGTEIMANDVSVVMNGSARVEYLMSCEKGGIWVEKWEAANPPVAFRILSDGPHFWPDFSVFRPVRHWDNCDLA